MPYITDENGDKFEYNVEHIKTDDWYKHKEPIHINDSGYLDTEDRHLIIKDAINNDHACSYNQLKQKLLELETKINNVIKLTETKIFKKLLEFRNSQIENRFGRKYGKIPKINKQIHELLNVNDIKEIKNLNEIIITNIYIKRLNWYYNIHSAHAEDCFKDSLELMFNQDMTTYNCYFTTFDNFWNLSYILEWIVLPKKISIEDENNNNINNENKPYIPNINIVPDGNN